MVYTCCICKWRANKSPPRSFHKFPTNESDKIQWLEIVGKNNVRLSSRPVVCSLHFKKDCFRYGSVEGRAFLKQGSLPTLYLTPESAETCNNSIATSSPSTETKSISSTDAINFCEITMERIDKDVIQNPLKNNKICLQKSIECGSIHRNREIYLKKKLKEQMKKFISLKRQNQRLRISKSNMKARMSDMKAFYKKTKLSKKSEV